MKKKLVLLNISLFVLLSACGNSTNTIEGEVKTLSENQALPQTEGKAIEENKSDTEVYQQSRGFVFDYDGIAIEVDAEANPIIEQLGEAKAYFEAPSCAFEGVDKVYTYNSFELDTYPMDKVDHISTIVFKDDTIATKEGVGIGDSAEKVTEIYGEDTTSENGMLVYEKDGMKLCFIIKEDCVVSVEYRSTVLDEV